ncbi:hypothetical protein [Rhizobium leguminosarum]
MKKLKRLILIPGRDHLSQAADFFRVNGIDQLTKLSLRVFLPDVLV